MRRQSEREHLPFLLDEEHSPSGLLGHFAAPQREPRRTAGRRGGDGDICRVRCLISPESVPRRERRAHWNYSAVHLYGRYRRVGQRELSSILRGLSTDSNGKGVSRGGSTASLNQSLGHSAEESSVPHRDHLHRRRLQVEPGQAGRRCGVGAVGAPRLAPSPS